MVAQHYVYNSGADRNAKYHRSQAGFRAEHETSDHVFTLHSMIERMIKSKERLYCCFIDFTKCFDTFVHDFVWYRLAQNGARGKLLKVLRSMYSEVKSRVRHFDGSLSEPFICYTLRQPPKF